MIDRPESSSPVDARPRRRRPEATGVIAVVIATIAIASARYGGVEIGSQAMAVVASTVCAIVAVVTLGLRSIPGRTLAFLGVALLAVGAALCQATPLPTDLVRFLSPTRVTAALDAGLSPGSWTTLSYYPEATLRGLQKLIVAFCVLSATALALNRGRHVRALLSGVFLVGLAQAVLCLTQAIVGSDARLTTADGSSVAPTGTFINASHFCQFVNLTMGAGLGVLLAGRSGKGVRRTTRSRNRRLPLSPWQLAVLGGLFIQGLSVAVSLSRAGVLAMCLGGAVVLALTMRSRHASPVGIALLLAPVVVAGGLLLLPAEKVYRELGTLNDASAFTDRAELSRATLHVASRHPVAGAGLGTHAYVFPAYDTTESREAAEHADNDYAQLLEETGLIGAGFALLMAAMLAHRLARAIRRTDDPISHAAHGLLYGFLAVGVQSLSDFGQRTPAVFCTSAALAGVACVLDTRRRRTQEQAAHPTKKPDHSWLRRLALGAAAAAALALTGLNAYHAGSRWVADRWWQIAYAEPDQPAADATRIDLVDRLAAAERASALRPADIEYRFWLNELRWRVLAGNESAWPEVIDSDEGRGYAGQIADDLAATRALCPTYAPATLLEGRTRTLLGEASGPKLLEVAIQQAPNNVPLAWQAATTAPALIDADLLDETVERIVRLDRQRFREAIALYVETLQRPERAVQLAAGNPKRLRLVSQALREEGDSAELADSLEREADRLTEELAQRPDAPAKDIAMLAARRAAAGDYEAAIDLYRAAIAKDFYALNRRLALVEVLVAAGRLEEAYQEAKFCLRTEPSNRKARRLAEELSLKITPDLGD